MLGYRKGEDGEPEIVPEEAEHIKMIFNLFLLGRSLRQIKEALERRNVLTPRGNTEWSLSSIEHILRNGSVKIGLNQKALNSKRAPV